MKKKLVCESSSRKPNIPQIISSQPISSSLEELGVAAPGVKADWHAGQVAHPWRALQCLWSLCHHKIFLPTPTESSVQSPTPTLQRLDQLGLVRFWTLNGLTSFKGICSAIPCSSQCQQAFAYNRIGQQKPFPGPVQGLGDTAFSMSSYTK